MQLPHYSGPSRRRTTGVSLDPQLWAHLQNTQMHYYYTNLSSVIILKHAVRLFLALSHWHCCRTRKIIFSLQKSIQHEITQCSFLLVLEISICFACWADKPLLNSSNKFTTIKGRAISKWYPLFHLWIQFAFHHKAVMLLTTNPY